MDVIVGPIALFLFVVSGALAVAGNRSAGKVCLLAILVALVFSVLPMDAIDNALGVLGDLLGVLVLVALVVALGRGATASRGRAQRERRTSQKRRVERD